MSGRSPAHPGAIRTASRRTNETHEPPFHVRVIFIPLIVGSLNSRLSKKYDGSPLTCPPRGTSTCSCTGTRILRPRILRAREQRGKELSTALRSTASTTVFALPVHVGVRWAARVSSADRLPVQQWASPQDLASAHIASPSYNAPARTRTWDIRLRRPMLYPAELQAQSCASCCGRSAFAFHQELSPRRPHWGV